MPNDARGACGSAGASGEQVRRDEVVLAAIAIAPRATLGLQALPELPQTRAAAGAGAAAAADLFDRTRAVIDDRVELAI